MLAPQTNYILLSDQELFQLTRQEDTKAYEVIYHRHWPRLIDTAYRRLFSRQKAEDLVQDLFINIYQRRHAIELTGSLQAYLNQAVKYRILNAYRSSHVEAGFQESDFFKSVCKNDFAVSLEAKELTGRIEEALNRLPEKCRQAFMLSRREQLANKAISESMQISVSTVEKHIGKALKILRESVRAYQLL